MGDAGPATPISVLSSDSQGIATPATPAEQVRDIHVLVTGFGPFKSFINNPSWLIASSLSKTLEPEPELDSNALKNHRKRRASLSATGPIRPPRTGPYRIHIHTYPSPVRVAYASVATFVPSLLDPRTNNSNINFDYILHIGLASGRDSYTLETIAHRDHYKIKDVDEGDGYLPGEYVWKRESVPEKLEVGWEGGDVLRRWESLAYGAEDATAAEVNVTAGLKPESTGWRDEISNLFSHEKSAKLGSVPVAPSKKAVVKLSRDAGRFLCEFIFMCSLVVRWRDAFETQMQENGTTEDPREKVGKVMFLHVPNGTDKADVARGRRVAESAIRAVVASWEEGWRNPNVYTSEDAPTLFETSQTTMQEASRSSVFEVKGTGDA